MCKINSSEQDILSYKSNTLNFSEHQFNYAPLANFVSTNLKTSVYLWHNRGALTDAHAHAALLMAVKGDQYSLLSRQLK